MINKKDEEEVNMECPIDMKKEELFWELMKWEKEKYGKTDNAKQLDRQRKRS